MACQLAPDARLLLLPAVAADLYLQGAAGARLRRVLPRPARRRLLAAVAPAGDKVQDASREAVRATWRLLNMASFPCVL